MDVNGRCQETNAATDTRTVVIAGRATIQGAGGLKESLVAALGSGGDVTLDVSRVTEADPALFQLICAAHRTAEASGVRLSLALARSDAFTAAAAAAGFHHAGGCRTTSPCPLGKEDEL